MVEEEEEEEEEEAEVEPFLADALFGLTFSPSLSPFTFFFEELASFLKKLRISILYPNTSGTMMGRDR